MHRLITNVKNSFSAHLHICPPPTTHWKLLDYANWTEWGHRGEQCFNFAIVAKGNMKDWLFVAMLYGVKWLSVEWWQLSITQSVCHTSWGIGSGWQHTVLRTPLYMQSVHNLAYIATHTWDGYRKRMGAGDGDGNVSQHKTNHHCHTHFIMEVTLMLGQLGLRLAAKPTRPATGNYANKTCDWQLCN